LINHQAGKIASKQANIQAELNSAGAKLAYNARRYHTRRGLIGKKQAQE